MPARFLTRAGGHGPRPVAPRTRGSDQSPTPLSPSPPSHSRTCALGDLHVVLALQRKVAAIKRRRRACVMGVGGWVGGWDERGKKHKEHADRKRPAQANQSGQAAEVTRARGRPRPSSQPTPSTTTRPRAPKLGGPASGSPMAPAPCACKPRALHATRIAVLFVVFLAGPSCAQEDRAFFFFFEGCGANSKRERAAALAVWSFLCACVRACGEKSVCPQRRDENASVRVVSQWSRLQSDEKTAPATHRGRARPARPRAATPVPTPTRCHRHTHSQTRR
jgi:hypothetical protein